MKFQFAATLWQNPHTRWAGIAYVICKFGLQVMEVWFQSYDQKIRATAEIIEAAAVFYGLNAAGAGNAPLKVVSEELEATKEQTKLIKAQDAMRNAGRTTGD